MGRRGRILGVIAVIALLVGLGGCGGSSAPTRPSSIPASSTTSATPGTTAPPPTTQAPAPLDVRVYLLHGETIDVAHRTVPPTVRTATAALDELLAGPTPTERALGLTTAVPPGTRLLGVTIAQGTATVNLTSAFASGGGSLSMRARLAQVTFTLTQFPTVNGVVYQLEGTPVTVFGGEGIMLDHPTTRAMFEDLTPAILVETPGAGSAVHSPVRIAGTANVFEAQFEAELTDSSGAVIATAHVTASSGTGTRGTFDTAISFPPGSHGAATLSVFDTSPKDGSRIDLVQIPLQLADS